MILVWNQYVCVRYFANSSNIMYRIGWNHLKGRDMARYFPLFLFNFVSKTQSIASTKLNMAIIEIIVTPCHNDRSQYFCICIEIARQCNVFDYLARVKLCTKTKLLINFQSPHSSQLVNKFEFALNSTIVDSVALSGYFAIHVAILLRRYCLNRNWH